VALKIQLDSIAVAVSNHVTSGVMLTADAHGAARHGV